MAITASASGLRAQHFISWLALCTYLCTSLPSYSQQKKNFAVDTGSMSDKNKRANTPSRPDAAAEIREAAKAGAALNAVVRDVLQHELRAQAEDSSLWCFNKLQEKEGKKELFSVCQTKAGEVERLVAVNGKPLEEYARKLEHQRVQKLISNREQLRKQKQQQQEDGKQASNMLKMIPDGFLFQQESKEGNRIKLKFMPNNNFRPSGYSAMVFHHMEGTLILDLKQKRLVEISGRLNSDVKFGGGLLGHLEKGGTFYVRQQDLGSGTWEVSTLDVHMNGKALLFKTIAVRTREVDSDFRPVPQSTTIQQAAVMTDNEGSSAMARLQK
jgi:hypothetical protein